MKKTRFTETQIIAILRETDAGMKVEEVCRNHGISSATYYNWKSKYGGMEAADIRRLKELEEENTKPKKMFAEASLENHAMKEHENVWPLKLILHCQQSALLGHLNN